MVFKAFLLLFASIAFAQAGIITPVVHAAPAAVYHAAPAPVLAPAPIAKVVDNEYDPNPHYSYAYNVEDALTGDSKTQIESRDGDVVQGSYSLTDSDGTRRTVDYVADPINGFNAVVRKEPLGVPAAHVAPIVAKYH